MSQVVLTPFWQVFDANGNPAAGAKASFFTAGTSTPVNVFSDSTLVTAYTQPVVADSEGRFPTIYAAAGDYKIKVTDSANVDLAPEVDNWTVLANLTQTILSFPTVTKTTNYTVVAADRGKVLEFDAAGGTLVVTLGAATLGAGFPIWIVNAGVTGTIQLQFAGAETLLDLTTYSLTDTHQAVGITSRGAAGWRLIAAVTLERLSTIASAGTVTLGDGQYAVITGTTAITDIDFTNDIAGHSAWVKFSGSLLLTHNATTLILPSGVSITTQAGDTAKFVSEGSDAVRCLVYNRATGAPLFGGVTDVQAFTASGTWNKPSGGTLALIRGWAGGASGGKGSVNRPGGGGGGGGYNERWVNLSALGATETVTIGAGGPAQTVANTNGTAGGNTTFGTWLTAYGGGAGAAGAGNPGGGGGGGGAIAQGAAGTVSAGGAGGDGLTGLGTGGAGITGTSGSPGFTQSAGGGGGGGGDTGGTTTGALGGNSVNGGGGGGGATADSSPAPGAGGTSISGGAGGAGNFDTGSGVDGTQPGGGGGGCEVGGNSGKGGDGQVIVYVFQ